MAGGSWSSSFIWGRNHSTLTKRDTDSYVIESVVPVRKNNFLTGRYESVDKDELFADNPQLEHEIEHSYGSVFRIGAYTVGYTRDIPVFRRLQTGIGANVQFYTLPIRSNRIMGLTRWGATSSCGSAYVHQPDEGTRSTSNLGIIRRNQSL
jgi:hypothetical protein